MYIGIDLGSTKTAVVIMDEENHIVAKGMHRTKANMNESAQIALKEAMDGLDIKLDENAHVVTTGYGRKLVHLDCDFVDIPEILAIASGGLYMCPDAKMIIDIGGQDSKVVLLDNQGEIVDFKMNDICAAGTGRFLENMIRILEVPFDQIDTICENASEIQKLNTGCAVFAESEVISKMSQGAKKENILAGICYSIALKACNMAKNLGVQDKIVFTGGVAKTKTIQKYLIDILESEVVSSVETQYVAALGAALKGKELF